MLIMILIVFLAGYLAITLEHRIKINKAASALLTGVIVWTIYILFSPDKHHVEVQLEHSIGEFSAIVFFLMCAMTLVELIDLNHGFQFISSTIKTRNKKALMWIVAGLAFFISAVLDNLTTTIVMITLLRKLVLDPRERLYYVGIVIIAANAGGVWSPIGDVTTTMLWIGGQLSSINISKALLIPSLVCLLVPTCITTLRVKGEFPVSGNGYSNSTRGKVFFFLGVTLMLMVPVFKIVTDLPPYMGMLFMLGLLWLGMEIHDTQRDDADPLPRSVAHALKKVDMPSLLFFVGILLSISGLQAVGLLETMATFLTTHLPNDLSINFIIGLASSIFDNVPLVAASMGMFNMTVYPPNHQFWEMLAYCSGTGGSSLIIGSAAGVAAMGMERISFFWYLKHISLLAFLGYCAGLGAYLLQIHLAP